jgi:hypothetical protein
MATYVLADVTILYGYRRQVPAVIEKYGVHGRESEAGGAAANQIA